MGEFLDVVVVNAAGVTTTKLLVLGTSIVIVVAIVFVVALWWRGKLFVRGTQLAGKKDKLLGEYTSRSLGIGIGLSYKVFVSYSHRDEEWCRQFIGALRSNDVDVWFDDDTKSGEDWVKTIQRKLEDCQIFIAVVSPDSVKSKWCERELSIAIAANKIIYPILLKPTNLTGILRILQYIDAVGKHPGNVVEMLFARSVK